MPDAVRYANGDGVSMSLWDAEIIGNYKSAKLFKYEINGGHLFESEKEFDALLVIRSRLQADALIDLLESDSVKDRAGRLYFGDWFLRVKPTGLQDIVAERADLVKISYTFYAPSPSFMRERDQEVTPIDAPEYEFSVKWKDGDTQTYKPDFELPFPFDLDIDRMAASVITNEQLSPAHFLLVVHGPIDSIEFSIGENDYSINTSLTAGQTLTIDTMNELIYKTLADGTTVDAMQYVSDTSNVFEPIPPGENQVEWQDGISFSLTLFEQRKVPLWG